MVAGHRKNNHDSTKVRPLVFDDHAYLTETNEQIPTEILEAFLNFCTQHGVYQTPEKVKPPTPGGPPIQLITAPTLGFACTACSYCVKDLPTMQRHYREKHDDMPLDFARYRACSVQHLFTAIGKSYFEVSPNLQSGGSHDLGSSLRRMLEPRLEAALVTTQSTERERTPLIRFTGWDLVMVNIRNNSEHREAANSMKQKHTKDEHDGIFIGLREAVKDHFLKTFTILDGHPHKFTILKIMFHGRNIPRES